LAGKSRSPFTPPPPPDAAAYEVGYAKPPTSTRFKSGRSGNPKGRPRGARNRRRGPNEERLKQIIVDEAYRAIKMNEGDKRVTISMAEAIVRSVAVNAAKGLHRSQRLFAELLSATERANKHHHDEWLKAAIEYKVDWEAELERRRTLGIVAPDPLPHPDDIVIDMRTGEVLIKGPLTKEEKAIWDRMRDRVVRCDEAIATLSAMLKDPKQKSYRHLMEEEIAHELKVRNMIVSAIGEPGQGTPKPHRERRR
jgi:hypothetical protein